MQDTGLPLDNFEFILHEVDESLHLYTAFASITTSASSPAPSSAPSSSSSAVAATTLSKMTKLRPFSCQDETEVLSEVTKGRTGDDPPSSCR